MAISVLHETINGVQVLRIGTGPVSIDEVHLADLSQQLLDYVVSIPPQVVIDMQNVEFYGSSFIETLFRMWNRIKGSSDGFFALAGLQTYCREILKMTNLDSIWSIYADVDEAVAAYHASQD